ncbi:hypothetical protein [Microbacterium sp. PM5]|uniref:hypothetical protein n=1 Tax=Microbacterium sp. PM5 TaxID=2014534 RepID=UPI000DD15C17|nr:hypothetical protein [Microbacterium sp. PM5]AXA95445.1 hypothetical protein CEP17_02875 [Microbacterium sp. PM5]
MTRRALSSLTRTDIGAHLTVTIHGTPVEGTLRAVTHGIFNDPHQARYNVPLVGITLYQPGAHATYWASPDTTAELTHD